MLSKNKNSATTPETQFETNSNQQTASQEGRTQSSLNTSATDNTDQIKKYTSVEIDNPDNSGQAESSTQAQMRNEGEGIKNNSKTETEKAQAEHPNTTKASKWSNFKENLKYIWWDIDYFFGDLKDFLLYISGIWFVINYFQVNPSRIGNLCQIVAQLIFLGCLITYSMAIPDEISAFGNLSSSTVGKVFVIILYVIFNFLPSASILIQYNKRNEIKFGRILVEAIRWLYFVLIIAGSIVVTIDHRTKTGAVLTVTGIVQDRFLDKAWTTFEKIVTKREEREGRKKLKLSSRRQSVAPTPTSTVSQTTGKEETQEEASGVGSGSTIFTANNQNNLSRKLMRNITNQASEGSFSRQVLEENHEMHQLNNDSA